MKVSIIALHAMVLVTLVVFPSATLSRRISKSHSHHNSFGTKQARMKGSMIGGKSFFFMERPTMKPKGGPITIEVAGSSLPDCWHACGSCSPCRLVMVSSVCASLEEAETCPMAYKCMCKNKSYPVP